MRGTESPTTIQQFFMKTATEVDSSQDVLPSYDVFDEERYFEPGKSVDWIVFRGKRIGITICEDAWNVPDYLPGPFYDVNPVFELGKISIDLLVNISASPYHLRKTARVGELLKKQAACVCAPLIYVNQVGGNDELIFQGHSMIWDEKGDLLATGADFTEDLIVFDTEGAGCVSRIGVRPYLGGYRRAYPGTSRLPESALSTGRLWTKRRVDSAVVACLASLALGAENVLGVCYARSL